MKTRTLQIHTLRFEEVYKRNHFDLYPHIHLQDIIYTLKKAIWPVRAAHVDNVTYPKFKFFPIIFLV